MEIRTLLVDSSYLIKRSFNGAKDTYTSKFGHIGALYSFLTTVRKLIKEHRINKVVLVWDGENSGIYRHNIDSAYKANRKNKEWHNKIELSEYELKREKEKEESILKQRKRIQAYAEELFLRQIEVDKVEGDDIIAAYCMQYHNKEDIFLYSNDRDYAQLLDLNIQILFDKIDIIIDKNSFFLKFPYHYTNALTMKILCGDSSDNIPGVKGIKEKTLFKHFPDLTRRYVSVNEIYKEALKKCKELEGKKKKPLKIFENIVNSKERLVLNHQLINLKEPFLNEQAKEELEQLSMPLSDEDRNSKNLLKMMKEDDFLSVYGGDFASYVQPFYTVIMNEKKLLHDYQTKPK